jgi:hypothetical protein
MSKILEKIAEWLEPKQTSELEQFINSKNPTNAAEVEQLTREYETTSDYWGRGL